jgi:hypothetical protein
MRMRSISAGVFAIALSIGATPVALGQDAAYCRQAEGGAPQCFFKDRAECESQSEKRPDSKCVQNPRLIDRAEAEQRGSTPLGSSVGEPPRRPSGGEPPHR